MKKTLLAIYLITILFICTGCGKEPPEFDSKSKGWELWASGIIDKISTKIDGTKRTFVIEFEGDLRFESKRFHNFEDIKKKTKGSVYRWSGFNTYYMWVPNENIDVSSIKEIKQPIRPIMPKTIIPTINNTKILMPLIRYEWQNIRSKQPPFEQTAIIKFKNGLITIAYYKRPGIWKAEIDRNKMSGGIPLKNIVQWKLVDLK